MAHIDPLILPLPSPNTSQPFLQLSPQTPRVVSLPYTAWSPRVDLQNCSPSQSGAIQFSVGQTIIPCGALFDYGATPDGSPINVVFTITNIGGSALLLGPAVVIGDQSFTIPANIAPVWIVPGASRDVTVQFNPTVSGPHSATLTCDANGLVSGCVIDLTGVGMSCIDPSELTPSTPSTPPHFNGSAWDFGDTPIGTPATGPIRFTNSYSAPITGITVGLTGDSAFSIVGTPFSGDLNPGDYFDLTIQLLSDTNNAYLGQFVVHYNEDCGTPKIGDLAGSVVDCVPPVISSQPVTWDVNDQGSPAIFSAVVTGTIPLSYQWQESSNDDINGGPLGDWSDLSEGGFYSGVHTNQLSIDMYAEGPIPRNKWYRLIVTNACGTDTSNGNAQLRSSLG